MKKTLWLNALFLFFSACGDLRNPENRVNTRDCHEGDTIDANGKCVYAPSAETIEDVLLERKYIKDTLDAMPLCKKGIEHEDCELIEVTSSRLDLNWQDAYQDSRVMLIEGSSLGRCHFQRQASEGQYKRRIIGRYQITSDGTYESCESVSLMPRGWARLMHERPGAYKYIPSKAIGDELVDDLYRHFPGSHFRFEHGNPIVSIIADYTPQVTFVLTESPSPHQVGCGSFKPTKK